MKETHIMTRPDLEDAIYETLMDTCDMDIGFRDYARAIVMMLETKGVVRCEADAEMVAERIAIEGLR
jgi:hypothetical protein